MNPGLAYLLRKKPLGWWRIVARRLKGTKGVLLAIGALLFAAFLIGPQVFLMQQEGADDITNMAAKTRLLGPPVVMLLALFGMASGTGLVFRRCEVDFLFPAPVGRRELLLYHVCSKLLVIALSALWVTIFTMRLAPRWYGALLGIFLAMAFTHLLSQVGALLLSTISMRLTKLIRRILVFSILVGVGVGLWWARQQLGEQANLIEAAEQLAASPVVTTICAPARVFVEVFASESLTQFGAWSGAALAMLVALFGLIAWLDIAYTEAAVRTSHQVEQRLKRMRSGGGLASATPAKARFSIPHLPWLGGSGPLAWRQCLEALRSVRGILIMGLTATVVPAFMAATGGSADTSSGPPVSISYIMVLVMTVFMTPQLTLDFRRDLDRMEYLKSLPLRPAAVALGQILPATVIITAIQLIGCIVITLILGGSTPWPWPSFALLLPFNCLAIALDNVLFLYFPHRIVPNEAGNAQFMGRVMLSMMLKMLALMLAVAVAVLVGLGLAVACGDSLIVGGLVTGVLLAAEALGALYWLGSAFRSFDPKDVPG